ncbi:bifunctional DNA primase/polymerase [uncultured Desulfobacter sp.]|uniref:bifunctional DNA primase/polymerase n=1 Tax=uncultured Desulfobacter sp. TaxID=240139 RepID=UPI0029F49B2C|nr:bifunctional DNA primase/polymerase [uncultured Desulfobacter sp.]
MTNRAFKAAESRQDIYRNLADVQGLTLIKLNGKEPFEPKWTEIGHRDYDDIGFSDRDNAGIVCGMASKLLVLDIDDNELFQDALQTNGWDLPETFTVKTGRGGYHYYFRYPEDGREYRNRACQTMGFDIRGEGGQVVAPGSVHPETQNTYITENKTDIIAAPEWLLELAEGNHKTVSHDEEPALEDVDLDDLNLGPWIITSILEGAEKGKRSEAIWKVLLTLVGVGCADGQILGVMEKHPIGEKYREKGSDRSGWLLGQIQKARDTVSANQPKVTSDDLKNALAKSEQGDADLFVKMFRGKFCYDSSEKKWFKFNGITWEHDRCNQALNSVSKVADEYLNEAKRLSNRQDDDHLDYIKALNERYGRLNKYQRMTHVLTLAASGDKKSSLAISGDEWNADPWILGCKNGVVDLNGFANLKLTPLRAK